MTDDITNARHRRRPICAARSALPVRCRKTNVA
jgi:hypothetical protein